MYRDVERLVLLLPRLSLVCVRTVLEHRKGLSVYTFREEQVLLLDSNFSTLTYIFSHMLSDTALAMSHSTQPRQSLSPRNDDLPAFDRSAAPRLCVQQGDTCATLVCRQPNAVQYRYIRSRSPAKRASASPHFS